MRDVYPAAVKAVARLPTSGVMSPLDRLVSKIAAGGLSAGVFLFWWPVHVTGTGIEHLVLRGLLWTASFELLLLAFGPFERLVAARLRERAGARALAAPRGRGALALACVGVAAPAALLAGAPHELVTAPRETRVVKRVVVERPVVEREVVVRRVVAPAPATETAIAAPAAPGGTPATGVPARAATRAVRATPPARAEQRTAAPRPERTAPAPAATTPPPAVPAPAPAPGAPTPPPAAPPAPAAPAPAPAGP